ncbi:hypothetical protein SAY86_031374 [Trapa natans]|uniref:Myb/SANT-like domain-containing protein n=1 Tax=Trapa natans TaxID=22666 RepID=A0AAN7LR35_TRANT|nr:hypothetical protein SAY86_031374 [Trapa natans]
MGIEAQATNDRLRTVWMPEMDRYFIDLMLEQVSRGNRVDDNLFSKRAWKNMVSMFNAKFKSHYEKDILKNRYKSLRNLYRVIRNILDQSGFYWDDTHHMVMAENNIWDEYIKAHPNARPFRIKSFPYYRDLCLIYENTLCKQKELSSHSSLDTEVATSINPDSATVESMDLLNDISIDEDFSISTPDGASAAPPDVIIQSPIGSRTRTCWEPHMDRYFIDLMLDQMQRGNQVDGIFLKRAWNEMVDSFNTKFGFCYEIDILKNRYKTLRRQYNIIKKLLEMDGFCWDDSRRMVIANDYVWQEYIKEHPKARQFMTRSVPYYKDLCIICRDLDVNDRVFVPTRKAEDPQASKGSQSSSPLNPVEEQTCHILVVSANKSPRKRPSEHDQETQTRQFKRMTTLVSSIPVQKKEDETQNSIPIESVIEAIQALPDMDDELILDACDFLEEEKRARTFMALDIKLRRKWLIRKLRAQR